ncbi:hypothetical protein LY13_004842 [Prauserella aidingensis]|uniref:hypothetical protein n=1 Tax=Prauserella aidingensis TaxID=387890 RepID=UPI0020A41250|nr:hypothetical protein [Prauserella aidingensis]MCP2256059.1 hypothetical protein [Prauserella aidingensis]
MPIRTNRGRAAIYRRLWSWPMRSPSHLAGTLILFTALIVATGIVVPRLVSDGQAAGAEPPTSESASAQAGDQGASDGSDSSDGSDLPPVTRLTEPRETPSQAPADPKALRVAEQWAAAWVDHDDTTVDSWIDGMRPYTTAEFLPVMRSVDPANIPATKVEGKAEAGDAYPRSVEALVSTDGPDLSVTVIKTDQGWRVSDYSRVG